jgi:hypothetical protein
LRAGCGRPSDNEEHAREGAGGHKGTCLRLKDDLLAVVKGEGESSRDTLANQGLVTEHGNSDTNLLPTPSLPRHGGEPQPVELTEDAGSTFWLTQPL